LASLLFIKAGWFPVVVTRDDRAEYIDALEVADESSLSALVSFFVNGQRRELGKAMRVFPDARPIQTVSEAIAAAKNVLHPGKGLDPAIWVNAKSIADKLMAFTETRLEEIKKSLETEIGQTKLSVKLSFAELRFPELLQLAYEPNTSVYHEARALSIGTREPLGFPFWSHFEVHAHAIGSKFRGLIGFVSVFSGFANTQLISKAPFLVNYAESYESAERRFRPWLEESLVNALTLWRKSL